MLGFKQPGASLIVYQTDPVICLTLSALVILGGLGFLVWDEVWNERKTPKTWSVYTRLVLITVERKAFRSLRRINLFSAVPIAYKNMKKNYYLCSIRNLMRVKWMRP